MVMLQFSIKHKKRFAKNSTIKQTNLQNVSGCLRFNARQYRVPPRYCDAALQVQLPAHLHPVHLVVGEVPPHHLQRRLVRPRAHPNEYLFFFSIKLECKKIQKI